MNTSAQGTLYFLEDINRTAAQSALEMENLLFEHPSSSIVMAGIVVEEILDDVIKREEIYQLRERRMAIKIGHLYRKGYITKSTFESLTFIRLERNKASHEPTNYPIKAALDCHEELYKAAKWYVETYGDLNIEIPTYRVPKNKQSDISEVMSEIRRLREVLPTFNDPQTEVSNISTKRQIDESIDPTEEELQLPAEKKEDNDPTLTNMIEKLDKSSPEAVDDAKSLSKFKKYLHIRREIDDELLRILEYCYKNNEKRLILLCGNVGDGKSHLLGYLNEKEPELMSNFYVINDATESKYPKMEKEESLEEDLKEFSDQHIHERKKSIIVAINMGSLNNFINSNHKTYTYKSLIKFINDSKLFSDEIVPIYEDGPFSLLSFGDFQYYELTEKGAKSSFYQNLLRKITDKSPENPFYNAYKQDIDRGEKSLVHYNYELLQNPTVQNHIVQLIIGIIINNKIVISTRDFLNLLYKLLNPLQHSESNAARKEKKLKYFLPNALFDQRDRSDVLKALNSFDPLNRRIADVDRIYINLNTSKNLIEMIDDFEFTEEIKKILTGINYKDSSDYQLAVNTLIRTVFLMEENFFRELMGSDYYEFIDNLFAFNVGNLDKIEQVYDMVEKCVKLWQGSINDRYVFLDRKDTECKLAKQITLIPDGSYHKKSDAKRLTSFSSTIKLYYKKTEGKIIELEIDYPLYKLLKKVIKGYIPNTNDEEVAVKFVDFIEKVITSGQTDNELLIHFPSENLNYLLQKSSLGRVTFSEI